MAITTLYQGIEYRSRLEAKWAAFFDRIGWQTTYEPFDGDGYIPDFVITGPRPLVIEVKPAVLQEDFWAPLDKVRRGLKNHWTHDILIVGVDPLPALESSFDHTNPAAGVLGETSGFDNDPDWTFATGNWATCTECNAVSVFHDLLTYACRPCGHYDGDHFLAPVDTRSIQAAWDAATNDVKWRGRAA